MQKVEEDSKTFEKYEQELHVLRGTRDCIKIIANLEEINDFAESNT